MISFDVIFRDEHADLAPTYEIMELEGITAKSVVRQNLRQILAQTREVLQ